MFDKLGIGGIIGILCCLGGLAVIAYVAPVVAGGLALVLVGLALVVRGLLSGLLSAFGMEGMI
jgi:uncharacterized membrane protein